MALLRAVVVLGLLAALALGAWFYVVDRQDKPRTAVSNPAAVKPAPPPQPPPVAKVDLGEQTFGRHNYGLVREGQTAVAIFSPVLPRNDAAVLAAGVNVAKVAFSATLHASTAVIEGREILVLGDGGARFYLFLIKEDTGEVHSIRIRQGS